MGTADRGRRGCRLCPYQLPCRRSSPCKESPAPDLPRRFAAGDCLMGFNSASWGFNSASWSSGLACQTAAAVRELPGQQRGGCHRAPPMIKRSEAAAAIRPGPAAPSRLTALVIPQVTPVDQSGWAGAASSACGSRARLARVVLPWGGDRSPVRGCTTTGGDQVLGHSKSPYSPVSGHAGMSPGRRLSPVPGERRFLLLLPVRGFCSRVSVFSR